jgi:hypothetical protein
MKKEEIVILSVAKDLLSSFPAMCGEEKTDPSFHSG